MCFAFAEEAVMAGETGECNLPRGIKEAPSIRRKEISLLRCAGKHQRGRERVQPEGEIVHGDAVLQENKVFRIEIVVSKIRVCVIIALRADDGGSSGCLSLEFA